jgi:hypothetical protein
MKKIKTIATLALLVATTIGPVACNNSAVTKAAEDKGATARLAEYRTEKKITSDRWSVLTQALGD